MQQIPRPQLGTDQYHDLLAFQAFTLMNTQLALSRAEFDLKTLAEQLVVQTKRAEAAEADAKAAHAMLNEHLERHQ